MLALTICVLATGEVLATMVVTASVKPFTKWRICFTLPGLNFLKQKFFLIAFSFAVTLTIKPFLTLTLSLSLCVSILMFNSLRLIVVLAGEIWPETGGTSTGGVCLVWSLCF